MLEQALAKLQPAPGGLGHNNPPLDDDVAIQKSMEISEAANNISAELGKAEPDALVVGRNAQALKVVFNWASTKANMAADEFSKKVGQGAAVAALVGFTALWIDVVQAVQNVLVSATTWLSSITAAF